MGLKPEPYPLKFAAAGGGGKNSKPDSNSSDPSLSVEESKLLPLKLAILLPSAAGVATAADKVSATTGNQAPLPLSPAPPPPTISDSTTSAPALASTPPPHAAARPEHTLPRALVQCSDPKWQPDDSRDNCAFCSKEFTWLLRRHHCRCSKSRAALEFSFD